MIKETLLKLSKLLILVLLVSTSGQESQARGNPQINRENRANPLCVNCLNQAAALFAQKNSTQALELLLALKDKCTTDKNFQLLLLTIASRSPGKEALALEAAQRVLSLDPESQPALLTAGMLCLRQEKKAQAQEYFEALVKSDPTSFEAWLTLQEIYAAAGESEKARAAANKASFLEPASLRARLGLLANLNANGKRESLVSELNKQLDNNQLCPEFCILLGNCALDYGFPEQASKAYSQASRSYPQLASLQNRLALAQIQAGELDEAEQTLGKHSQSADKILLESWLLFERKKGEEAQTKLKSLQTESSNKALKFFVLALAAENKGELETAQNLFQQSLEADKAREFALAKLELIKLELQNGNTEEALAQARIISTNHCGFQPQARLLEAQAVKTLGR